jgi:hypothetical protein
MIYHATMLRILFVNVVYKLDKEWCLLSLDIATFCGNVVGEDDAYVSS